MSGKTRVIILFGGRSAEHEVSILSARNVWHALDRDRFEPLLIGIDKHGRWRIEPEALLEQATGDPRLLRLSAKGTELVVPIHPDGGGRSSALAVLRQDDVVLPVLHGTYGEDGTVQGLLELADVAYVGAGPLGSAIGMDKDVTKRLLSHAGIPVVPWRVIGAGAYQRQPATEEARAAELGFPVFVKPANAGSSVGISRVRAPDALRPAIEAALAFDHKVLVEAAVNAREIECSVLGNDDPEASLPGEVIVTHPDGYYSYDAKYVDETGAHWKIPADLPPDIIERVRTFSTQAFQILELSGMARVDFFLVRATNSLYLNEVNTIPGFTAISMYPKMWEASGVPAKALISRLIELAVERRRARRALKTQL